LFRIASVTELSSLRRRELKARAHAIDPVVVIGAAGLSDAVLAEIDRNLRSHELIKVRVPGADRDARDALLAEICLRAGAHPVQHIGKVLVVFRENPAAEPAGLVRKAPARRPATRSARR
jgi:RNA-binding protein